MKRDIRFTNRDIVEILKGDHKYQKKKTFAGGLEQGELHRIQEKAKVRKVGEKWEEYSSEGEVIAIWTQMNGYRIKESPNSMIDQYQSYVNDYPNCYTEECKTKPKTALDKKYKLIYGMCTSCAAKFETNLKTTGQWQEFERTKMLANAKSFFKEADDALEEVVDKLAKTEFVNDDGSTEKWAASEEKIDNLKQEYNMYKKIIIESLEGKNDEIVVI